MINKKLKDFRVSIQKSQEEMAKIWGISYSFYKKIECGAKSPSLKTIKKFKEKFPSVDAGFIFLA